MSYLYATENATAVKQELDNPAKFLQDKDLTF